MTPKTETIRIRRIGVAETDSDLVKIPEAVHGAGFDPPINRLECSGAAWAGFFDLNWLTTSG
jgi:hypothetical protein